MNPDDRKYTQEHEWALLEDAEAGTVMVGITHYAQDQLGDVVYLELPDVGAAVGQLAKMGEIESGESRFRPLFPGQRRGHRSQRPPVPRTGVGEQ